MFVCSASDDYSVVQADREAEGGLSTLGCSISKLEQRSDPKIQSAQDHEADKHGVDFRL